MGIVNTGIPGLKLKDNKLLIDKVVEGVRIYKTLDTTDIIVAQKILARLMNETLEGRYLPKRRSSLTVQDILDQFWNNHLSHKEYAKATKCILDSVANRLGDIEFHKLSRTDLEKYKRERAKDKKRNRCSGTISPRTIQKELQHLSMAINYAVDNGVLDSNPVKRFMAVPQGQPKKVVLDDGYENGFQWNTIYKALCVQAKPIALVLYETGMRPKECFHMQWNWFTQKAFDRWVITVPMEIDKTGNEHDIPVSLKLLALFKSMGMNSTSNSLVFPAPKKSDGIRTDIESAFTNALHKCGLHGKGISPYALRRTRVTIWDAIDSNASRYAVGHVAKEIHLRHYVRIPPDRLFKLVGLDFKQSQQQISSVA